MVNDEKVLHTLMEARVAAKFHNGAAGVRDINICLGGGSGKALGENLGARGRRARGSGIMATRLRQGVCVETRGRSCVNA